MSVSYVAAIQNARMDAVITGIDNHASPAKLEIGTAAMAAVLATLTLNDPSFVRSGTPPNVLITLQGVPKNATATGTGTAAAARIRDGGNADQVTGLTVGTSGTDIILNSTSITTGQTVSITAGTIKHAA
jgi:hypothetical protein